MTAQLAIAAVALTLIAGPRALTSMFSREDRIAARESLQRLKLDERRYRIRYALGLALMVVSIALGVLFVLHVRNLFAGAR